MRENAEVLEVHDGLATVAIRRQGSCDKCGKCDDAEDLEVEAQNSIGAKPGQMVIIEMKNKNILGAAFLVYFLPLINLFIGYFIGKWAGNNLGFGDADLVGAFVGIISLLSSFLITKKYGEKGSEEGKYQPVIKRVVRNTFNNVECDLDCGGGHNHH
ncbi:SoxR reducing system RseC family protein [Selenihalanaerobacter shriftii]|uniref:Positive regulator of sigma(E), RseC/MucC n=1 Tax=Selenihalanaerobacter shriftii TaxID=142842 RepID=A0A1T4KJ63_9FIRM|nr:SoxR reducing system RseC family protein [Selenihalanaerobacter shriftii]SJZ42440.1 positive regulator of sigma(E), RseC/MucC [Selenihalanaerobacter shriftii]